MQWKGTIPAGQTFEKPMIQLDVLPTALAAAGVEANPAWKLDGVNLLPYVKGETSGAPHQTLYWRFGEQWAIRHGDWKLVVARGGSGQPELYNLAEDLGENTNLASSRPDKVRELQSLWNRWNAEQAPPLVPDAPARTAAEKAARKAARKAAAKKAA
jgi:arylsulfatase A-like enzyme